MTDKTPRQPHTPFPEERPPEEGEHADLREALNLWREDAAKSAARVDVTGDLADRVVAAAARGRPLAIAPAGARWYAAAALLLITVGVTGTLLARDAGADARAQPPRWAEVEDTLLDVLVDDPKFSPGLEGR